MPVQSIQVDPDMKRLLNKKKTVSVETYEKTQKG